MAMRTYALAVLMLFNVSGASAATVLISVSGVVTNVYTGNPAFLDNADDVGRRYRMDFRIEIPPGETGGYGISPPYCLCAGSPNPITKADVTIFGSKNKYVVGPFAGLDTNYVQVDFSRFGMNLSGLIGSDIYTSVIGISFQYPVAMQSPFENFTGTGSNLGVGVFGYRTYSADYTDSYWDGPIDTVRVQAGVPEPSTWSMMLIGFAAIVFAVRRRNVRTLPA